MAGCAFKLLLAVVVLSCMFGWVQSACKLNVLYMIDISGSVRDTFGNTKRFVKNITQTYLDLGPDRHQIAWIFHTASAHGKNFRETKGMTTKEFLKMLDEKTTSGGSTKIHEALKEGVKTLGTRDKTLKTVVIYITDGRNSVDNKDPDKNDRLVERYAKEMRAQDGVTVLAASANARPLRINRTMLRVIAGSWDNVAAVTWPGNEPILEVMKKVVAGTILGDLVGCVPAPTTTSTSTTTTTTPPTTGCELDLCIIVDSSTTTTEEFEEYKKLANRLIDGLEIGARYTRISVIQFSSVGNTITVFHLNKKLTEEQVKKHISSLQHYGGTTAVGSGLERALEEYKEQFDTRMHEAKRCAVLYSDGFHNRGPDPSIAANALRAAGVELFVVGLSEIAPAASDGNPDNTVQERYTDMEVLKSIAGPTGHLFDDRNYDQMVSKIKGRYNSRCR